MRGKAADNYWCPLHADESLPPTDSVLKAVQAHLVAGEAKVERRYYSNGPHRTASFPPLGVQRCLVGAVLGAGQVVLTPLI